MLQRLLAPLLDNPLLDNALRYARSSVRLHGERWPAAVVLVVEDDAPGVAAQDAGRVFQPGWRADPDDDHPGGDLGLALTARLVTATGGSITCRPGGDGGRFGSTLPAG